MSKDCEAREGAVCEGAAGEGAREGEGAGLTLFSNGRISTNVEACPEADAMLVEGERILWAGREADMPEDVRERAAEASCARVDLAGARVIPGFVDAHMHAVMLADFARQICAMPPDVSSIAELTEAVRARREAMGSMEGIPVEERPWIMGWGYDEKKLAEHRTPTRWDLDEGSPDVPVCILRSCAHIRCVNSVVLEMAGITRDTPDPEGGTIERDENGEPTGVLVETARELVVPFIPVSTVEEHVENLVALGELLSSQGVVAVTDMGTFDDTDNAALCAEAAKAGFAQTVAVYGMWPYYRTKPGYSLPAERQDRSRQIFNAGVKLLGDGSVSGRTAWVERPYEPRIGEDGAPIEGQEPEFGLYTMTDEELDSAIAFARANACQVAVHAMGSRTIDHVVDRLADEEPWEVAACPQAPCARIEHLTEPSAESIAKMAEHGIAVVTQPVFLTAEVESYVDNLGMERARHVYPFRTLLDAGVRLSLSTDAPATLWNPPSDPFFNLCSAVTRVSYDGRDMGQGECLDVADALRLYTLGSAEVLGIPDLGRLDAGYQASFAVLDQDILEIEPARIADTKVEATYIRGRKVYER